MATQLPRKLPCPAQGRIAAARGCFPYNYLRNKDVSNSRDGLPRGVIRRKSLAASAHILRRGTRYRVSKAERCLEDDVLRRRLIAVKALNQDMRSCRPELVSGLGHR